MATAVLAWVDNLEVVLAPDFDDSFKTDPDSDVKDICFLADCREAKDAVFGWTR